jgi:CHAT domain-containing protein/Tfp pilus assembly protein PilF
MTWRISVAALAVVFVACRETPAKQRSTAATGAGDVLTSADGEYSRGEYDSARVDYLKVVDTATAKGDTLTRARALTQAGLAAWHRGDYVESRRLGERALALKLAAGFAGELAKSYNALGLLSYNEGRFAEAIDAFDHAERAAAERGDSGGVAKARGNRGLVYSDIGDFPRARAGFEALLAFGKAKPDAQLEGNALVNLGMVEIRAGAPAVASPLLREALRVERTARFAVGEENALGQLGTAYQSMGDPQAALAYLDSALQIASREGFLQQESDDLQLLAAIYDDSGDHGRALEMLGRAAALADSLGLRKIRGDIARAQSRAFAALGDLRSASGSANAARRYHGDVRATLELLEDELTVAELSRRIGNGDAADSALMRARRVASRADSPVARAELALGEARVAELAGKPSLVLSTLHRASPDLSKAVTGRQWEAAALQARAYAALGRLEDASRAGHEAVRAVEKVRSHFSSGALRSSFTTERARVYGDLVMILLRRGNVEEALRIADAARSRALLEHLAAARNAARGNDPAQDLAAAEQLLRRIDQLVERLRTTDTGSSRRSRLAEGESNFLTRQLADARRDYELLMERSQVADRRMATLARGSLPSVLDIQASLRPGEAVLEYFVSDSQLVTFVVSSRGVHALPASVRADELASRIRLSRELITRREVNDALLEPVLSGLFDILVRPALQAGLLDDARSLIIVPHASLAYLPFAALTDERTHRRLIEQFDLLELPAASALAAVRHSAPPSSDAKLVAAVFAPFPGELPGTKGEAEAIAGLASGALPYLGSGATEQAVREALAKPVIVHIATHGVLNPRAPMFSRLELSRPVSTSVSPANDGRLEVHEVLDLSVRSPLVFLSGCETGTGAAWSTSFASGDDYATLAEAFLYAGARNVVATLWRIDDSGAAEFASTFYRGLERKSPVEALAVAQRAMLASRRYASPYYWAAYVVSGDGGHAPQNRTPAAVQ